ncbi:MAG: undecaprenyl-diphosphatase UppP [Chloroflexi bacterium]|nr:undecaprenyl-diphosphatase UppP [Chloroflexota bacterium]
MTPFEAVVLGIVQGLSEFLPISSSGQLILARWLFGWEENASTLVFDVALHLGTLVAVLTYFWRDWVEVFQAIAGGLVNPKARATPRWRLGWLLVIGSIPGALIGLAFESAVENLVRQPAVVAVLLMVFGLILLAADRVGRQQRELADVRLLDALAVGFAQALALVPGVSRSGITLTAGLLCGLERATAARFSFLLSSPIIFGAGLWEMRKILAPDATGIPFTIFLTGMIASAVVGFLAIGFLLRYLSRNSVAVFVWYRLAVGLAVLALLAIRGR